MRICKARVEMMNFSGSCSRRILSALAGLILVAAPMMVAVAAADSDDIAAYQSYGSSHGYPPSAPYAAPSMSFAQRNELQARLNYAAAQYEQARRAGDRAAAKHWRKQVKHLSRELYGERHAQGQGYGQEPFPPTGYPAGGYPAPAYPAPGYPVAAPAASESMGGLGSLLGPLLGGGAAPSAAPYAGYPQSPNGAAGIPGGTSG